jgi:hypothetical protein
MSEFLETLKMRLLDAQKKLQETTAALQKAQLEHAASAQEHASWANAVNTETRREQQLALTKGQPQTPPAPKPPELPSPLPAALEDVESTAEVNKTGLIREVLERHPNGVRPVTVWHSLRDQVNRNYVYSVLSRMKQKKQVREIRGKYYLNQPTQKALGEAKTGQGGNGLT